MEVRDFYEGLGQIAVLRKKTQKKPQNI